MGDLLKIAGVFFFLVFGYAVFDDGLPKDLTVDDVAAELGIALAMIAVGYLADVRDAIVASRPNAPPPAP